jgi:SAM-dependent methyltransferase
MFGIIADELKKMIQSPERALEMLRPRRWRQFFGVLIFNARTGGRWKNEKEQSGFRKREYSSYEQYVRHQQSKLSHLDLGDYDVKYRQQLRERLAGLDCLKRGTSVLCLGARLGTEVKAFQDLGCFALGLDLNPGPENKFVLRGDFHEVQFPSGSVEVIFTNSFDHVFDSGKFIGEIRRLLKPGGGLIIAAIHGEAQATAPDHYASFWWARIEDLVALLGRHGFKVERRMAFELPWPGEQIYFSRA